MDITINLNSVLNGLILLVASVGAQTLRNIHRELRTLNGRVTKVEAVGIVQERMCAARLAACEAMRGAMEKRVEKAESRNVKEEGE